MNTFLSVEINERCKMVLEYVPYNLGVKVTNQDGEKEVYLPDILIPEWMDPYHPEFIKKRSEVREKVLDILAEAKKKAAYNISVTEKDRIGVFRFKMATICLRDTKGKTHTWRIYEMADTTITEYNPHIQKDEAKIVPRVMMRTMASDGTPVNWVIPYSGVPREPTTHMSPKKLARVLIDKRANAKAKEHASVMVKEMAYVFDVYRSSVWEKAKNSGAPKAFFNAFEFRVEKVIWIATS